MVAHDPNASRDPFQYTSQYIRDLAKLCFSTSRPDEPEWWIGFVGGNLMCKEEEIYGQCTLLNNELLYGKWLQITDSSAKAHQSKAPQVPDTWDELMFYLRCLDINLEGFMPKSLM